MTEDTRLTNLDDLVLDSRCLCNYLCNIAMDISPSLMGNSTINGKFQWQVAFFSTPPTGPSNEMPTACPKIPCLIITLHVCKMSEL